MDQDFPRKVTRGGHGVFFLFCLVDRSLGVEEGSTIMGKVAEGKEKTRAKWKNWKIS